MTYPPGFKTHIQSSFAQKIDGYGKTIFLECELTTRCLNNCSYCGADIFDQAGEVDFDTLTGHLQAYATHARENGLALLVSLVGGDPVLYSRFDDLLAYLAENKLPFFVKGNASTLSSSRVDRLKGAGCLGLKLTCFGEEPIHNAHRGLDTFKLLVERTAMAQSKGLLVAWHLSVAKQNLDSMRALLPFIRDLNLDGISEGRVGKLGKLAAEDDFADITPHEWRAFMLDLLHFYAEHGQNGFKLGFRDKLWIPLLAEEGLLDLDPFRGQGIRLGCDLFTNMATVDYRGYLKSCGLIESVEKRVVFHPGKEKRAIYLSSDTANLKDASVCGQCTYRDFCRGCRAITLAHTGDAHAQDPHCWVNRATQHL